MVYSYLRTIYPDLPSRSRKIIQRQPKITSFKSNQNKSIKGDDLMKAQDSMANKIGINYKTNETVKHKNGPEFIKQDFKLIDACVFVERLDKKFVTSLMSKLK